MPHDDALDLESRESASFFVDGVFEVLMDTNRLESEPGRIIVSVAVVVMAIVTSLITPPLLRLIFDADKEKSES